MSFKPISSETLPWPKPSFPFQRVNVDFFTFQSAQFFIYVDPYTKWCDVSILPKCTAEVVIDRWLCIFSAWGYPLKLCADNGPPFHSTDFVQFCTEHAIELVFSPIYHPQSNYHVERMVQIVK